MMTFEQIKAKAAKLDMTKHDGLGHRVDAIIDSARVSGRHLLRREVSARGRVGSDRA